MRGEPQTGHPSLRAADAHHEVQTEEGRINFADATLVDELAHRVVLRFECWNVDNLFEVATGGRDMGTHWWTGYSRTKPWALQARFARTYMILPGHLGEEGVDEGSREMPVWQHRHQKVNLLLPKVGLAEAGLTRERQVELFASFETLSGVRERVYLVSQHPQTLEYPCTSASTLTVGPRPATAMLSRANAAFSASPPSSCSSSPSLSGCFTAGIISPLTSPIPVFEPGVVPCMAPGESMDFACSGAIIRMSCSRRATRSLRATKSLACANGCLGRCVGWLDRE